MSTNKKVWWAVVAVWSAVLIGLGIWSALRGDATIRDQRDIGSARQVIDQVVGQVSGNVPAEWRFFDEGYQEESCDVTIARDGIAATRTVALSGPVGTESDAVSRVASGLDGAAVRPGSGPAEGFFLDAGDFVAVRGSITAPGTIVIQLKTGCRPHTR